MSRKPSQNNRMEQIAKKHRLIKKELLGRMDSMHKKLITLFVFLFCLATTAVASADAVPIEFFKAGGGQFIYCNNPEFLKASDLSSDENPTPTYLMNNEGLEPDRYQVFFCQYNDTDFDIEPDIEFVAQEDAVITINSISYRLPDDYNHWDCVGTWADFLGVPIRTLNATEQYVPFNGLQTQLPVTFNLQNDTAWISSVIYNYSVVSPGLTFNMLVDFTIESGSADVNFTALKNYGVVGDRSHHDPAAANGAYFNDSSIKGIEPDSLAMVECDLDVTIDRTTPNGSALPVKIFNQYFREGTENGYWMTNINPGRDDYLHSKYSAATSDMLSFVYKDQTKSTYFGSNVTKTNDVWHMDPYHYNTQGYEPGMPGKPENHIPNAPLGTKLDIDNLPNSDLLFNLGNFGVTYRYRLNVTNNDQTTRSLNYCLETSQSSNLVIVRDLHENILNPYTLKRSNAFALCKGINYVKKEDCMFSVSLEPGETKQYIIDVILPTNCYGGMVNVLRADTHPYLVNETLTEFPKYTEYTDYGSSFFNGENYMCWLDGVLYEYIDGRWQEFVLPESARKIFDHRGQNFHIVKSKLGYAAKFSTWDAYAPEVLPKRYTANTVYLFDLQFNLLRTISFDSYIENLTTAYGNIYVEADKKYVSTNGVDFEVINDNELELPMSSGRVSLIQKQDRFYRMEPAVLAELCFESLPPQQVGCAGSVFYAVRSWKASDTDLETPNIMAVSEDGINWVDIQLPDNYMELMDVEYRSDKLSIYCRYQTLHYELEFPEDPVQVNLNGRYLCFDTPPQILDGRTMVPLRFLFEQLDEKVTWLPETREIVIGKDDIRLQVDNTTALVHGEEAMLDVPPLIIEDKTFVPLRFLTESLGYDVVWDQESHLATITEKPKPYTENPSL